MNKSIFTLATAIMLMVGAAFTGCESDQERVADAREDVSEAKQDLAQVKRDAAEDAQERANDEEWRVFKNDAENRISDNEARIDQFQQDWESSGKTANAVYVKDIEALEQRNRDLQTRINTYDNERGNWDSFKREFNHDMNAFGNAFKNIGKDNQG